MNYRPLKRAGLMLGIAAFLPLISAERSLAQKLDLNGNGMSDVWEQIYWPVHSPDNDPDGDGVINKLEAIAGTNPRDTNSLPKISLVTRSTNTCSVTMWGALGKQYQLQSVQDLASSNWVTEATMVARTSTIVTLTAAADVTAKFFRVSISDVDTDGDGLNDWEEYQLGLDPLNPNSNGKLDVNGQPLNDYAYVVSRWSQNNVVSISATDPTAVEPDPGQSATSFGMFTVSRGGFPLNSITVNLGLGGPGTGFATENLDHAFLDRPIVLPAGVSSQTITVSPLANSNLLAPVIAMMKVLPGTNYAISVNSNASVVIYPSPTPAGTGLTAQYFDNASATYSNAANFSGTTVTRIDPTIDFIWGTGSPNAAVNRDNFSASWDGQLVPTTSGLYQFDLQADDGARLYFTNQLLLDAWTAGSATASPTQSVVVSLIAGTNYPIRVEYYELTNSAMVHLRWKTPTGSGFVSIPAANVLRPGTNLTGWAANYYNNSTLTGPAAFTNIDSAVYFDWYAGSPDPSIAVTTYSARWTGQIEPEYSEPYTFVVRTDDGAKLWVNEQLILDDWRNKVVSDTNSAVINLQGGARYDIKMEYYQNTSTAEAHLSWYSPSQPKQIVPTERLYPASVTAAPSSVTSALTAIAFLGQPFSFTVTGANLPIGFTAIGLPPGLTFNTTNGVISGVPGLAGDFQISLTSSNAIGASASVLDLEVLDTGSAVTREIWSGVPGTNVSDIPVGTPPSTSASYGSMQGIADFGDNYGERIRGRFVAPVTGDYYFWISASDSAELWISNDSEAVNKVRRAWVTSPGTTPMQWNAQPNQRSPWLALVAGQSYYFEILHKAGTSLGDHWELGWRQDPTGTNTTPSAIVPAYLTSRYFDLPPSLLPGTLYTANMLAQSGALSRGVGAATLRVSPDGTQAILKFEYSGLSGPITAEHIHTDSYLGRPSEILFDIDTAVKQSDGSYVWNIVPVSPYSVADIQEIIREGKSYINLHTALYPGGEINGHFVPVDGSQTFTPPPPAPVLADDHADANAAARFLIQSTFGPSPADIAAVQSLGYEGWIDAQFALPITTHLTNVYATVSPDPTATYSGNQTFNTWWRQAVTAPDQLRQRFAFALSEIMVVSESGVLNNNSPALSSYYDTLLANAFGNYRQLLEAVTLHPAMGLYLDMRRNDKGDITLGTHPNENYAREIQQLFSVGLYRLWPDGTLVMNSGGNLVPTYGQDEIMGFARVFTGWNYNQPYQTNGHLPTGWNPAADYINPMVLVPTHHELGSKRVLDNVDLPPAQGTQLVSTNSDYDAYGLNDLELGHDSIFQNQNVGPFICRQLIQRLVTSNPSRGYLYRVVQQFNDNGSGVRGDMKAVIKAILLDYEARSSTMLTVPTFGKQREPLCRVTAPARALASPPPVSGTYTQLNSRTITINTATPHRLGNSDTVVLSFTDTSGAIAPTTQAYSVSGVNAATPNLFTVTASGNASLTYTQTLNTITVTSTSHGLNAGNPVYLVFSTGGGPSGLYSIVTVPNTNSFTVTAPDSVTRGGNGMFPKWTGGGFTQSGTTINFSLTGNHGLNPGDNVLIDFPAGAGSDGQYVVGTVPDLTHFTVTSGASATQTVTSPTIFPLVAPPMNRSGNATLSWNTWNMNATDTGTSSALAQTPLESPTVFNFFLPDYRFPGILASAGLTTPEFQLTSDTTAILQLNFLQAGILGNANNTNGLTSFNNGNGAITLDIGPWMTTGYTATTGGISNLVDNLSTLMTGGQISAGAKSQIVNYVATLSYGSPTPTAAQIRDRVRAAVHLILDSPEFTIQK
jgi:hypothetical protein